MSHRPPPYPKRPHQSGQARIRLGGRTVYLGVWGSSESHARYSEEIDRWRSAQSSGQETHVAPSSVRTLEDLATEWLAHAETIYRTGDRVSPELRQYPYIARVVLGLFRNLPVRDFGPRQLIQVQGEMRRLGWAPRVINRQIVRVRTIFRWAEQEGYAPANSWNRLRTVRGLVTKRQDVPPAPEADLAAALKVMTPPVRGIVQTMLWTGGRPSEIMGLRPCDIVRTGRLDLAPGVSVELGSVWAAILSEHKTSHLGHTRILLFGPKAQEAIWPFLGREPTAYLFSPGESDFVRRRVGKRYRPDTLNQSVGCACACATPPGWHAPLALGVPAFTPYQMRHNAATRLASEFGWDVARIILGHRTIDITRQYVADDLKKAVEAIRKAG